MKKSSTDLAVRGSKMPRCFVQRCSSSSRKKLSPSVIFHVFPNRLDKILTWLLSIQQSGQEIGDMEDIAEKILEAKRGDRYRICSEHFTEDCYVPGGLRKTLKRDAVPSVFQAAAPQDEQWVKPPCKRAKVDPAVRRKHNDPSVVKIRHVLCSDPVNTDFKMQVKARERTDMAKISENIFNFTLEIMCLLTGEDCIVVNKTSGERVAPIGSPNVSGGFGGGPGPQNQDKMLELTFQILQQLAGEDAVKHEGSTVSFFMDKTAGRAEAVAGPSPGPLVKKRKNYKPILMKGVSSSEEDDPLDSEDAQGGPDPCEGGIVSDTEFYASDDPAERYPATHMAGHAHKETSTTSRIEYTSVRIKEEPDSEEEPVTDPDYTSADDYPYTSFQIKEESMSGEEEEEEGTSADVEDFQPPRPRRRYRNYGSDEETDSCEEGTASETDAFPPADLAPQFPSTHSDLAPPAMFGGNLLQNDFLFGEGSSFDTDVSALIKHAHTKFSFAPIEEGSGSDEDEEVTSTEVPSASKDHSQAKSSSGTDEAAGEEGSASQVKKDYQCSECSETFVRRSDFANHRRNHRRERLTCPECGKLFSNKPSLLNHLTGHTGEKPYSCNVCGKCFTRNSNLIVHQAVHMERSPLGTRNVSDFLYIKPVL